MTLIPTLNAGVTTIATPAFVVLAELLALALAFTFFAVTAIGGGGARVR